MKLNKYYGLNIILFSIVFIVQVYCFTTEFENQIKEKIYISESLMKNKKFQNKFVNTYNKNSDKLTEKNNFSFKNYSPSTPKNKFNSGNDNKFAYGVNSYTNKISNNNNIEKSGEFDVELGSGPVFSTGWIKFFKYKTTAESKNGVVHKTPKTFILNGQFNEQFKLFRNINLEEKCTDGSNILYTHVHNKFSFYTVLMKNSMNILTSRNVF